MKVRQDAWSHEDDLLLAETVLRYIREGGTQLGAFEEVGDKLNRTSAACGFRWNAEVRKRYEQAIAIAKKQRKERKRALEKALKQTAPSKQIETETSQHPNKNQSALTNSLQSTSTQSISLDDCILFLTTLKQQDQKSVRFEIENQQLKKENEKLRQENKELEKKLEKLTEQQTIVQEDYQALVKIMDRARKLVLFEENDLKSPTFKMDKNGNLEQMANLN